MNQVDKIELLYNTLVKANRLLRNLGDKYCRDKNGQLNEKGIAVWDAEVDVEISNVLTLIQKENETPKEWLFNFKDGGWNSVYAKNRNEAYLMAVEKYKSSPDITPLFESFRLHTPEDHSSLCMAFN